MNCHTIADVYNPALLRQQGIAALTKALGPIGMARFIQQFGMGNGDYTAEREALLAMVTMDDFERYQQETNSTRQK